MNTLEPLYSHFLKNPVISTDSRKIPEGAIFFALKGERFDANRFVRHALAGGASLAVADDPSLAGVKGVFLVGNVLQTLQGLARLHRRQFSVPVIAITGSNGKTTTKELVSAVLGAHYKTHCTTGNLNNHIGVPLTLLSMPTGAEMAVIEMGANHQGEIAMLCDVAEPTHGLITNIGKAHLEGFGGLEGVKQGKSELYRYLEAHDGIAFINKGEPFLSELAQGVKNVVAYGMSEVQLLEEQPFLKMAFLAHSRQRIEIQTQLIGRYNSRNVATAIAVGNYFGVPPEKIKQAIESYLPSNLRSQIIRKGSNTVVMDAYNANPTSMRNAIETFTMLPASGKAVILGDMLELGEATRDEHLTILKLALEKGFGQVILVGPVFEEAAKAFSVPHFPGVEELASWVRQHPFSNTSILLKASRKIGLERLLDVI